MKKFAVVLAGCGVFDGAEIHEATLTLLAIAQHGAYYEILPGRDPASCYQSLHPNGNARKRNAG
jgi:enhancing lycopene biosynthesis protein 2